MPRAIEPRPLTKAEGRRIWLRAQRLDTSVPFGAGPQATAAAVEHLGYVQIDTINVIERCHHHILFSRIPGYRREHLHRAQTIDKSVFEFWTHALSYVPTRDMPYYVTSMKRGETKAATWFGNVTQAEVRKVISRIRREGPLSIRDIDDDELVEKTHAWASKKPSKKALQLAFFTGRLAISERLGMVKTYELMERHFGWSRLPKPARPIEITDYLLDRSLRAQGFVSLDSTCHLNAPKKPLVRAAIARRVRRKELVQVRLEGHESVELWAKPETLETGALPLDIGLVHILSPFDPLIIQRKRLHQVFGYEHRFEAYVPKDKRIYGYFALPVLIGDQIVAAIDLKCDRAAKHLKIQQWNWIGRHGGKATKARIEEALHRFEAFQLAPSIESTAC